MKKLLKASVGAVVLLGLIAGGPTMAFADNDHHDDHHGDRHDNRHDDRHEMQRVHEHRHWHRGGRIEHQDWDRGARVDYRVYHLHEPPPGYEWRQVGSNFILAAVATGIIASIIAAQH